MNRMDFLLAGVLDSVVDVAIWIVYFYINPWSRRCTASSLVTNPWLQFKEMKLSGHEGTPHIHRNCRAAQTGG